MELKQELKLRQELRLQPQQIMRSELLQLPILALEQRIKGELQENPFLEEGVEEEERVPSDGPDEPVDPEERAKQREDEVDWESLLNDGEQFEYRPRPYFPEERREFWGPYIPTLLEHLEEQLIVTGLPPEEERIGRYIIGNIDDSGYLTLGIPEIASVLNVPEERVDKILKKVQTFDPSGVGARSLKETLLIQLEDQKSPNLHSRKILESCFDDFKGKRYEKVARQLDLTLGEVKQAFHEIERLNPKPGKGFFNENSNTVIPDLVVKEIDGEFVVYLNEGDIPNFYVNQTYRNLILNDKNNDKKAKDFAKRKVEQARWFIQSIHQRRSTILRTMRAIVELQPEFFRKGREYLKPMILEDVAEEIGMDISTVSRVTNGKYVQTDFGVFELKYFFSERLRKDNGDEVSNKVIREKIARLIEAEDKKKPLSDQRISDKLKAEGFQVARRTVQKYREQLGIPVKRLRREI